MSTTASPARTLAGRLRRHRGIAAIVAAVLVTVAVLTVLTARSSGQDADLDPENPSANGAQAVARVLADRGVPVTVVRRAGQLDRTRVDRDTTVVVTSSGNLGRATADRLRERTRSAGALVLPGPEATLLRALRLPVEVDDARVPSRTTARCDDPLLAGLTLDVGASVGYRPRAGATATTCFRGRGEDPASLVARVERDAPTYAVGGVDLFTNERVDRADNAAAALRLLGQGDRLVWYVPDLRDVRVGDTGSLAAQLPGGLFPALWLLAAAVLATMLWRGRRLGPLVVEPLPVVVKAVESTQGRGRLYRRVRDRSHAGEILRAATCRRLVARLRLPTDTDRARLAVAVAELTGADPGAVHDLLLTRPVTSDQDLTRLAADLAALEREAHRP
jgi:hypothetical protein